MKVSLQIEERQDEANSAICIIVSNFDVHLGSCGRDRPSEKHRRQRRRRVAIPRRAVSWRSRRQVRQYMRFDSHFGKVKGGVHSVRWGKHVARANATFLNEIVATGFKVPVTVMLDCHTTTF